MLSTTLMALGGYRFSVGSGGYNESERDTEWRWVDLDVIGDAPVSQFIGPGEDCMMISGEIFPHYRGGLGQVDAMREQASFGAPLPMIDGSGFYMGEWTIRGVSEGRKVLFADGTPRKIEFRLKLRKYN